MADEIKETAEDAIRAKISVEELSNALVSFFGKASEGNPVLMQLKQAFAGVGDIASSVADSLRDIGIKDVGFATAAAIGSMTKMVPEASRAFGELGKAGGFAGRELSESLKTLEPFKNIIPGGDKFFAMANGMSSSANSAINLQKNIIGLYSASGNLNRLLTDSGGKFTDMNDITAAWSDSLVRTTMATGASSEQINNLLSGLRNIPGVLDEQSIAAGGAQKSLSNVVDILRVQSGVGMTTAQITDSLNFAYETMNLKGQSALEIIAQMSEASKDFGLPLQAVTEYVKSAGNAFKFFGDNTQTAMGVLSRLTPGLKDAGLGYGAIKDIISSVSGSLAELNVGQRAFISGAGGGPGGLRGAMQMLSDLAQGKGESVFKQFETAFKKEVGPMVTLEQAGASDPAAAQMTKQIEYLRAMGVKGSDIQLAQISDAFAKSGILPIKDKEMALQQVMGRGADFQERTATGMDLAVAQLERLSMLMAIQNSITLRTALGTENKGPLSDFIKQSMETNAAIAGQIGVTEPGKERPTVESLKDNVTDQVRELFNSLVGIKKPAVMKEGAPPPTVEAPKSIITDFATKTLNLFGAGLTPPESKLPTAATVPPKIGAPATTPPIPQATLAPAAMTPREIGAETEKAGVKGTSEKQLGILKVLIDTAFYENGMRKIVHDERELALKNGDIATVVHVRP